MEIYKLVHSKQYIEGLGIRYLSIRMVEVSEWNDEMIKILFLWHDSPWCIKDKV